MELILPIQSDRIRYTLIHEGWGSKDVDEPDGWDNDELEYSRNKTYSGIVANLSNSLVFSNNGADFIMDVRAVYGVNAKILCVKEERDPDTDVWTVIYNGFIDLTTYSEQNGNVSVKFALSGLEEIIKNRQDKDTEIEREESMDGEPIPDIKDYLSSTVIENRKIFLLSKLYAPEDSLETPTGGQYLTGSIPLMAAPELVADPNSDQEFLKGVLKGIRPVFGASGLPYPTIFFRDDQNPDTEQCFYFNNDRPKRLQINTSYDFDFDWSFGGGQLIVAIAKYKYNLGDDHVEFDSIAQELGTHYLNSNSPTSCTYNDFHNPPLEIDLEERDCLMLVIYLPTTNVVNAVQYNLSFNEINLRVEQESEYPDTSSISIMGYELCKRLLEVISGSSDNFYSEALGRVNNGYLKDGIDSGAFTAFAHGMWLRQFHKEGSQRGAPVEERDDEDDRYKPFTTSFKNTLKFFDAVWGLTLGIERDQFREKVIIEPIKHFFNLNTTVRLGKVGKIKRSEAADYYYSDIEAGYDKPEGDRLYEEAMGLDEYNVKTVLTTCIRVVNNMFDKVSPIRADSYGMEFARRKPFQNFPTEDTDYDTDVFAMDVKEGQIVNRRKKWKLRVWQDDFDEEPTGIFSPETAHNLRFSPMNLVKRNSQYLSGLEKYENQKVIFSSSTGNTKLETKKDGVVLKENGDFVNYELDRPRWIPEYIEFEKSVNFELNQQLLGTTIINGKEVKNFYGCVEFENERGELEHGFIISVKPNGKGSWKLLKANR